MSAWETINPETIKPNPQQPFDFTDPIRDPARMPHPPIPEDVEED